MGLFRTTRSSSAGQIISVAFLLFVMIWAPQKDWRITTNDRKGTELIWPIRLSLTLGLVNVRVISFDDWSHDSTLLKTLMIL